MQVILNDQRVEDEENNKYFEWCKKRLFCFVVSLRQSGLRGGECCSLGRKVANAWWIDQLSKKLPAGVSLSGNLKDISRAINDVEGLSKNAKQQLPLPRVQ